MQARLVMDLGDPTAARLEVGGGKGSSLSRLVQAGFPVPPGFTVTSEAYRQHVSGNELQEQILKDLSELDFTDAVALEATSEKIREAVTTAPVPAQIAEAVVAAYRTLGSEVFVAVRSSGTAEDLAEASFAGQHDTYLDVRGEVDVLDAVRRCWASLWTARACAYRQQKGFDHGAVHLAVVVQAMVAADVSGVMFTANPLTTAVNELVVNASWGLGEGVVSGILTPDQFTLDRETLRVKARELGTKEVRVVRDPQDGSGVTHEEVPAADRERFCLSEEQLAELGELGRRVTSFYGDWPQDIEWAFKDGQLHLLQSRDVTGVDFSWDEDLEDYSPNPLVPGDAILSRAFADEVNAGRKTPLFYSVRSEVFTGMLDRTHDLWGLPRDRWLKYHKGQVYWNSPMSYRWMAERQPKAIRYQPLLLWAPPAWFERMQQDPGPSWLDIAKTVARIKLMHPTLGFYEVFKHTDDQMDNHGDELLGLPPEQIRQLSDPALLRYFDEVLRRQEDWYVELWTPMVLYGGWVLGGLTWILQNWYTGSNPMIFADLITGLPRPTFVMRENHALWELAKKIGASATLSTLFESKRDGEFFAACEDSDEGRAFLTDYRDFLSLYGHRGHAERDAWYPRRAEDPSIDYRNFELLLRGADSLVPGATEERLIARREAAAAEVIDCIRKQSFSGPKLELFKALQDWALKLFMLRDNERFHSDRGTFAKKRVFQEIGRRLVDRGVLEGDDDFWYLSKSELLRLFNGDAHNMRVVRAKIVARRRNCERMDGGDWHGPMYIRGNGTVASDVDSTEEGQHEDGLLRGAGTSRGSVVGTARLVASQKDIGRVQKGEILVCHATDPGWTSVFMVAAGAVFETGGMLAHCSCISREYGIPAVQVVGALRLIEDGSTVEVNGDTGEVRILAAPGESSPSV